MTWFGQTKTIAAIAAALALTAGTSLSSARAEEIANRTVHDANYQFTLEVPASWHVQTPSGQLTMRVTAPPDETGLHDTIDVLTRPTLWGIRNARSCEEKAKWVTRHFAHINFTTLSMRPTTIGGYPAYAHIYTWKTSGGAPLWSEQACVVQQGRAYVLTGTTPGAPDGLAARRAALQQIMDTLKITEDAAAGASPGEPSSGTRR